MPIILNLLRLPGQVDSQQAAAILGVQAHDIPTLIKARLLKPLGNPKPNAPKYFAAVEVAEFARDRDFLDKAQRAIQRHWQAKNRRCNLHVEIMPDADNGRGARKGPQKSMLRRSLAVLREVKEKTGNIVWMSAEPISWDLTSVIDEQHPLDWIVVGAASDGRRYFQPEPDHVRKLLMVMDATATPVFYKGNHGHPITGKI